MNNLHTRKTKFSLAPRISAWWAGQRDSRQRLALRRRCPPATIAADQIPPAVRAAWVREAPDELPGLAVDAAGWLHCAVGLSQFFEACRLQRDLGPCALPSKAADSVWHVWLRLDPAGLAGWQQRYFGHEPVHREAEQLGAPLEDCIARTWAGACRSEGLSLLGPQLPLVFAVDGLLRLPAGWAYGHEGGGLVHRRIDGFGQPGSPAVLHTGAAASGLVALGLLSEADLAAQRRQLANAGSGCVFVGGDSCASGSQGCHPGNGGNGSNGSSDGSSDGGSASDGGSGGGSSCGGGGGC